MAARKEDPARRRRMPWIFMFLLFLVAVSVVLHLAQGRRGKGVRSAQERLAAQVRDRPIAKAKAERTRFHEIQYYLDYPVSVSYATAGLVLRLGSGARPLRLLGVQVDPGLQDLTFRMTVGIAAAGPEEARTKFAAFFEEVRDFPGITQASFSGPDRTKEGGGLYVFSIRGQAEWQ